MKTKMTLRGLNDVNKVLGDIAPREAKNIMRTTIHDMAKEVRDDARDDMPVDEGVLKRETKHKREKIRNNRVRSTVRVGKQAFYWRFLEYGDGPDGVAYDFFLKAVNKMRSKLEARFMVSFGRKFEAALARARKRQ